jgi:hypothetical protein
MSEDECLSCRKRPGAYACVSCEAPVCKPCSESLGDPLFVSLEAVPAEHVAGRFCGRCWDAEIAPKLDAYRETMAAAKQVFIFFTTQKKAIPLVRKAKTGVKVDACADRDETILRLAYDAAKDGYNAVVDVEVVAKKVNDGGSNKSSVWRGAGVPALVDEAKLDRQARAEQAYERG